MKRGNYRDFRDAIGKRESSNNYKEVNVFNYLGKYQFGEMALIDLGYVRRDATPKSNDYAGGWTGKDGIRSKEDFLNSPEVQDKALERFHAELWRQIKHFGLDKYIGQTIGGVEITESGLIGGAHLLGVGGVKEFIKKNGAGSHRDGLGTDVRTYIKEFGGYDVSEVAKSRPSLAPAVGAALAATQAKPDSPVKAELNKAKTVSSPLILDLEGAGISTTKLGDGAYFDHDGDGVKQATGWAGAGTGLLVLDRDGDGTILNGSELFGNFTTIAEAPASNGFEALRGLDANQDGHIDVKDPGYQALRVWIDEDADGYSRPSELGDLGTSGIATISLAYEESEQVDRNGNDHRQRGSYLLTDGSSRAIHDVWFAEDKADYLTPDSDSGDADSGSALPELWGGGQVSNFRAAVAKDATGSLMTLLGRYQACESDGLRIDLVAELLAAWAGKADVQPDTRGAYVNATHLAVLEALSGEPFYQPGWGKNPGRTAGNMLEQAFWNLAHKVAAQIDAQTVFKGYYDEMDVVTDGDAAQFLDLRPIHGRLNALWTEQPDTAPATLDRLLRGMSVLGLLREEQLDLLEKAPLTDAREMREVIQAARLHLVEGTAADETLNGTDEGDRIMGHEGNDRMNGKGADDVLFGGAGDDTIVGGQGGDTLIGGSGNDELDGGGGSDVYVFDKGFGHDRIYQYDPAGTSIDVAEFRAYASSEVRLVRSGSDLLLLCSDADVLTIAKYFDAAYRRVDVLSFSDGVTWDVRQVKARLSDMDVSNRSPTLVREAPALASDGMQEEEALAAEPLRIVPGALLVGEQIDEAPTLHMGAS